MTAIVTVKATAKEIAAEPETDRAVTATSTVKALATVTETATTSATEW